MKMRLDTRVYMCCSVFTIIICTIPVFSNGQNVPEEVTTEKPPTTCLKDEKEAPFVPNLYTCLSNEKCCFNEGQHSCCGTDISDASIKEQLILWGALIGILGVVGLMAACYFKDRYCCDGDKDEEDGTYCCCIKRRTRYRHKMDFTQKFYPDEYERNLVADPIFGDLGRPDDVPQFASIDKETQKTAHYI